jgi:GNAT superfamily N-acetyltransferase
VEVKALNPADEAALVAMLDRCSRTTLFRRFHSYSDGRLYLRALLDNGENHQTLLAWSGAACIGIANLAIDSAVADLGVLVEDAWQRHGVGSTLVVALLDMARSRGMTRIHADVLGEDQFILRGLRKFGPLSVSLEAGTFSVDFDIGPERAR